MGRCEEVEGIVPILLRRILKVPSVPLLSPNSPLDEDGALLFVKAATIFRTEEVSGDLLVVTVGYDEEASEESVGDCAVKPEDVTVCGVRNRETSLGGRGGVSCTEEAVTERPLSFVGEVGRDLVGEVGRDFVGEEGREE